MLKDILSEVWRKRLYIAFALGVIFCGAASLGFMTAGVTIPTALVVAEKVLLYVGGVGLGFTASANVPEKREGDA